MVIKLMEGDAIAKDLLDVKAMEYAKKLVSKDQNRKFIAVPRSQLRRLFNEVKRLERKLDMNMAKWEQVYPLIKMLKSKTSYAVARAKDRDRNNPCYDQLLSFITDAVDSINNIKEFKAFCLLFESVYGFYYQLGGVKTK